MKKSRMYESELDNLKRIQLKSPTKILKEQANLDDAREKRAQKNRILIAKTAAKQTLKELRQLSKEVHRLSKYVREGDNADSLRTSFSPENKSAYTVKKKTYQNVEEIDKRPNLPREEDTKPEEGENTIGGHR